MFIFRKNEMGLIQVPKKTFPEADFKKNNKTKHRYYMQRQQRDLELGQK